MIIFAFPFLYLTPQHGVSRSSLSIFLFIPERIIGLVLGLIDKVFSRIGISLVHFLSLIANIVYGKGFLAFITFPVGLVPFLTRLAMVVSLAVISHTVPTPGCIPTRSTFDWDKIIDGFVLFAMRTSFSFHVKKVLAQRMSETLSRRSGAGQHD